MASIAPASDSDRKVCADHVVRPVRQGLEDLSGNLDKRVAELRETDRTLHGTLTENIQNVALMERSCESQFQDRIARPTTLVPMRQPIAVRTAHPEQKRATARSGWLSHVGQSGPDLRLAATVVAEQRPPQREERARSGKRPGGTHGPSIHHRRGHRGAARRGAERPTSAICGRAPRAPATCAAGPAPAGIRRPTAKRARQRGAELLVGQPTGRGLEPHSGRRSVALSGLPRRASCRGMRHCTPHGRSFSPLLRHRRPL